MILFLIFLSKLSFHLTLGIHGKEGSSHGLLGCNTVKMEAARSSETMVSYHIIKLRNKPEARDFSSHSRKFIIPLRFVKHSP
jgi:hypothetical protein